MSGLEKVLLAGHALSADRPDSTVGQRCADRSLLIGFGESKVEPPALLLAAPIIQHARKR